MENTRQARAANGINILADLRNQDPELQAMNPTGPTGHWQNDGHEFAMI
jgi:hypothetical protein